MSDISDCTDESNDMVANIPDIESIERIRDKQRKEKKERYLEEKRLAEEEAKKKRKQKALKGMEYLLGISEKYSTFFKQNLFGETLTNKTVLTEKNKYQPTLEDVKDIKTDIRGTNKKEQKLEVIKHLKYFEGTLHPYQIEGVTWMAVLFENGLNGILADEMGLGKTVQVIALICYLLERNVLGPFLIVAPLSTVPNWLSEFKKFAPKLPVVGFVGYQEERVRLYRTVKKNYLVGAAYTRPIVITSYGIPLSEHNFLRQMEWQYIIVDEGHRLKNPNSLLSLKLRDLHSSNRLLLTGTPLQNNIAELWALLNFLLPHLFKNMDTFASLFILEEIKDDSKLFEQEQETNMISTIHRVLAPFMLRRLKKDVITDIVPKKEVIVYCPLSKLQMDLYQYVLTKNIEMLLNKEGGEAETLEELLNQPRKKRKCTLNKHYVEPEESELSDTEDTKDEETGKVDKKTAQFLTRLTMQNPVMMFKKIVNHPYLIHFPLDPSSEKKQLLVNEDLVQSSGKLIVLDAMLPKLIKMGHKILLFSTLVIALDLIEEYMILRGYTYRRLDGSQNWESRAGNISTFNEDPNVFVFLLSTRAGGLGLNLTGADTVIFFDRDWNPQADIQAQDRCHRIGQTKPVMVYTLVTKNTIDEKIINCGYIKRRLEKLVIRDGKFKTINQEERSKTENELLQLQVLLDEENEGKHSYVFSDNRELDKLLDRSELYEIMKIKKEVI